MPDYKLGTGCRELIKTTAKEYTHRLIALAASQQPFDRMTIQKTIMSEAALIAARGAQAHGFRLDPNSDRLALMFREKNMPGIERPAAIMVYFDTAVLIQKGTPSIIYSGALNEDGCLNTNKKEHRDTCLTIDTKTWEPEHVAAIQDWVANMVKAKRMQHMVMSTINQAMNYMSTTSSVLAWWPALAALTSSATEERERVWRKRFHQTSRSFVQRLEAEPVGTFETLYRARIKACDDVLTRGMMLAPFDERSRNKFSGPNGVLAALVHAWQPKPTDPIFTNQTQR